MGDRAHLRLARPIRRLAKDFEATIASAEAWIMIASVRLLSRRIEKTINAKGIL